MQIELRIDGAIASYEVEPGTLLSELLKTEQAVWLEGRPVNAGLMLAAQANGRAIELKAPRHDAPLQENLLLPEPSRC